MNNLIIVKSHLKNKKFDAIITDKKGNKKVIPFGAEGYSDYILSGGDKKKTQCDTSSAFVHIQSNLVMKIQQDDPMA